MVQFQQLESGKGYPPSPRYPLQRDSWRRWALIIARNTAQIVEIGLSGHFFAPIFSFLLGLSIRKANNRVFGKRKHQTHLILFIQGTPDELIWRKTFKQLAVLVANQSGGESQAPACPRAAAAARRCRGTWAPWGAAVPPSPGQGPACAAPRGPVPPCPASASPQTLGRQPACPGALRTFSTPSSSGVVLSAGRPLADAEKILRQSFLTGVFIKW